MPDTAAHREGGPAADPQQPRASAPNAPPARPASEPAAEPQPPRRPRRRLRLALLALGPLVALLVAAYVYVTGGRFIATDNAYVQSHIVSVSAEVSGRVTGVLVDENQPVQAGQTLFRIDPEPFRIALDRAEAQLDEVRLRLDALKAAYRQREVQLRSAEETVTYQETEFERQQALLARGTATQAAFDEARHTLQVARDSAAAVQEDLANLLAQLGGDANAPVEAHPQYREALAARDQAALDLRRTEVTAPADGMVSNLELRPGDHVAAGTPVFALAETGTLWIEANLKETDLTHIEPGQSATVEVDAFPGVTYTARVASVSAATGAQFAVLPAQNATGNWVKVVQRIPVRLALVSPEGGPALRAGMSATVEIDTQHHRWLPSPIRQALASMGVER